MKQEELMELIKELEEFQSLLEKLQCQLDHMCSGISRLQIQEDITNKIINLYHDMIIRIDEMSGENEKVKTILEEHIEFINHTSALLNDSVLSSSGRDYTGRPGIENQPLTADDLQHENVPEENHDTVEENKNSETISSSSCGNEDIKGENNNHSNYSGSSGNTESSVLSDSNQTESYDLNPEQKADKIICPTCGHLLSTREKFCHCCGRPVSKPISDYPWKQYQPSFNYSQSSVANRKPKRGSNSAKEKKTGSSGWCPNCGQKLIAGDLFCANCGNRIYENQSSAKSSLPETEKDLRSYVSNASPVNLSEQKKSQLQKVQFSAIAPRTFRKGDYTKIDIVIYEDSSRDAVDDIIILQGSPSQEVRGGVQKIQENSEVTIVLESPDINIEDNMETRTWKGDYLDISFAVKVPSNYKNSEIKFTAVVYINKVIATKLIFIVKRLNLRKKLKVTRKDINSVFVSYASQDRKHVAAIIQGMKKARPELDIFFDVENLRSGDDWENALHHEIEKRDILFLCWSKFAKDSEWVNKEWRYAYKTKGIEAIEPVPIESPEACPPPAELSKLHFNDNILYIINSR